MTGFRLARGGAQERFGITPDLSCFGKIIGGGLPVGAFGGRAEIMDCLASSWPRLPEAGTLSGNPLAMAAGIAALEELAASDAYKTLENLGATLEAGMRDAALSAKVPVQFNRVGSMFCGGYFTKRTSPQFGRRDEKRSRTFRKVFPRHAQRRRLLGAVAIRSRLSSPRRIPKKTSNPPFAVQPKS